MVRKALSRVVVVVAADVVRVVAEVENEIAGVLLMLILISQDESRPFRRGRQSLWHL